MTIKNNLFWLAQGRLGNQVFQYQAIKVNMGDARVISAHYEFFDVFENDGGILILRCPAFFRRLFNRAYEKALRLLVALNLFGVIEPFSDVICGEIAEKKEIRRQYGFLKNCFVFKGFYQNHNSGQSLPVIKSGQLPVFNSIVNEKCSGPKVAVHVRLGDYKRWRLFGELGSACLPRSFYKDAIAKMEQSLVEPIYLIFSDDPNEAEQTLSNVFPCDRSLFIKGTSSHDEFLMILNCDHAIISASTFAWWAAALIKNTNRKVVAPNYWLGHTQAQWYPAGIQHPEFDYINFIG